MIQFSYKFQIASFQMIFDPTVYRKIQFWTEMILPVSSFACPRVHPSQYSLEQESK